MELSDWVDISDIVNNVTSSIGVLVAGIWVFYTFILGRSFSANIKIESEIKQVVKISASNDVQFIVRIALQNIGKTKVEKEECFVYLVPALMSSRNNGSFGVIQRVDPSFKKIMLLNPEKFEILENNDWLEPGEEVTDEVLLQTNAEIIKMVVIFIGKKYLFHKREHWMYSTFLEQDMLETNVKLSNES